MDLTNDHDLNDRSHAIGHVTPPAFLGILLGAALSLAIWGAVGLAVL